MPPKKKVAARTTHIREAAIKLKNFLRLSEAKRTRLWDMIRDEPQLQIRVFIADVFPGVPSFIRFSVGAKGLAIFLIGDDPGASI